MAVTVPPINEIFEDAFERVGRRMLTAHDVRTARRSLQLICLEWQNRGLNQFMIQPFSIPLVAGQASYVMPPETIDVIEFGIRTSSGGDTFDYPLNRISVSDYMDLPNKDVTGRPTHIFITRSASGVTATLWPVPESALTLAGYALSGVDTPDKGATGQASVPPRFIPALTAGLAYYIGQKTPGADLGFLKQEYEQQFEMAASEDRERSSVYFRPMVR